ncbi:MAG TPA: DUF3037 domain-containing protein [Steroidobacteraceae bacterium]
MPPRIPCEFSLIRYVPDVVKGEFTNIGVLLRAVPDGEVPLVRFTRDWSRVRCIDPDADLALLESLEGEIAARLADPASLSKPILNVLQETFANSIQVSEPRATLAESIAAELELLMQMYVEPIKVKRETRRSGRAAIAARMRTEFERAGVWPLMRKRIAASTYTMPGDSMKLDCGYKPSTGVPGQLAGGGGNGVIRIFHAVSLEADTEAAKVLAWSAPRLREGIRRVESADLELAAVVEPLRTVAGEPAEPATEDAERYQFGVSTMEAQQIRVLTTADLARAAETARRELRL